MALFDPLANLPRPQKTLIGVIVLVALGALGYFLLVSPKTVERDTLFQQNEALRAEVIKARADEANLREFRALAASLRQRLEVARERLPAEKEMPRLYRQITDLALQSGLAVSLFQPRPSEDRGGFAEVPILMTAEGSYHQFGAFFDRMGRLSRVVTLGDFRLGGISQPTGTIRADLTLATYMHRPDGAAAPVRPGGPAPAPAPSGPAPAGGRS
jgi:type IV pilus assembly protein PilO